MPRTRGGGAEAAPQEQRPAELVREDTQGGRERFLAIAARADSRPIVRLTDDFSDTYHATENAVAAQARDSGDLWVRGTEYVTVANRIDPVTGLAEPVIKPLGFENALVWLADHIRFLRTRFTSGGEPEEVPATPKRELVNAIRYAPVKPVPPLRYVSGVPVVRADGTVCTVPGYDAASAVFYAPPQSLIDADLTPHPGGVAWALDVLQGDLLIDFPFVSDADRANTLALILEPYLRGLIHGPTPLYAVDSPAGGTGKGLLVQSCGLVATGAEVAAAPFPDPRDASETRKAFLSLLRQGKRLVAFDNANTTTIRGDVLDLVLTATQFEDRVLGQSEMVTVPIATTWTVTGLNLAYSGTIVRRVVPIRLDARVENPEERTGFRHEFQLQWVRQNLATLVRAAVTLIASWVDAGMPPDAAPAVRLGSYESWQAVVGGAVAHALGAGLLWANHADLAAHADPVEVEWRDLFEVWFAEHGEREQSTIEVLRMATEHHLLNAVLGDGGDRSQLTRLGTQLQRRRDRITAGFRLVRGHTRTNTTTWALVPARSDETSPAPPPDPF